MRYLLCCIAALTIVGFGQSNWETTQLEVHGGTISPRIAVDSEDRPHIVFGAGFGLGRFRWTGDTWCMEQILPGAVAINLEICMDADGQAHIAFHGRVPNYPTSLYYLQPDGDTWHLQAVIPELEYGSSYLTLALARDNTPHLLFQDSSEVKYAYKAGDSWNILTVPAEQADTLRRNSYGSLALDTTDRPGIAISWVKPGHPDSVWLAVFEYDGRDWHRFDIDSTHSYGGMYSFWRPIIRCDPATDLFHITHRSGTYISGRHNNWYIDRADMRLGSWIYDFALRSGWPHIIGGGGLFEFLYHWRGPEGWHQEPVLGVDPVALAIAVDRTGRPHAAIGTLRGELLYARRRDVGIEEPDRPASRLLPRGPTIVRGVLRGEGLGHDPNCRTIRSCPAPVLLDAAGRKVMDLQPGENDIRHLSQGVYFIRAERVGVKGQETRKVIVQR